MTETIHTAQPPLDTPSTSGPHLRAGHRRRRSRWRRRRRCLRRGGSWLRSMRRRGRCTPQRRRRLRMDSRLLRALQQTPRNLLHASVGVLGRCVPCSLHGSWHPAIPAHVRGGAGTRSHDHWFRTVSSPAPATAAQLWVPGVRAALAHWAGPAPGCWARGPRRSRACAPMWHPTCCGPPSPVTANACISWQVYGMSAGRGAHIPLRTASARWTHIELMCRPTTAVCEHLRPLALKIGLARQTLLVVWQLCSSPSWE